MKNNLKLLFQAHWLFLIIALIFGGAFIKVTPPLWGADEGQHFFRAYQISQDQISQRQVKVNGVLFSGGVIPSTFLRLDHLREHDIADAIPGETHQVDNRNIYDRVASVPTNKDKTTANPYSKNIYSPFVYTAPALGIYLGKLFSHEPLTLLLWARAMTLLFYVGLTVVAIYMLRKTFIKWLVLVVALLPMSIYQASVVSPDSLLLGISFIFFAVMYRLYFLKQIPTRKNISVLAVSASLLAFIKAPYVILVFLLTLLPLHQNTSSRQRRIIRIGIPILVLLVAIASIASVRGVIVTSLPNTNPTEQLHWIMSHPLGYAYTLVNSILVLDWVPQVVGLFGSSFVFIPGIIIQSLIVGVTLLSFMETRPKENAPEVVNRKVGGLIIAVAVVASLAIISSLYLTWTPVGHNLVAGIQGRYFVPIVLFILVGARSLTDKRLIFSEKSIRIGATCLTTTSLLVSVLWYYRILY